MIAFPNCKINLGLQITSKREDGYHELQTIYFPVNWFDVLEIVEANQASSCKIEVTGTHAQISQHDNICIKAWQLLKQDFDQLPFVNIYLQKNIPTGAGLGGGSADAANMILLLNKKYNLNISPINLINYATKLGADCAFFMINIPCFASGIGEKLEPIPLSLKSYKIVLVYPGFHLSTNDAFKLVKPSSHNLSLIQAIKKPVEEWSKVIKNDFEFFLFQQYPVLESIKNQLYHQGALYSSLSGSGSTVFAIFENHIAVPCNFPENYIVHTIQL